MKVLVACEFSGVVRDAFRKKGHDAWSCDLRTGEGVYSEYHIQGDVRNHLDQEIDLLIAHPPCTALSVAGNKHYANSQEREDAIRFFRLFLEAKANKICVENPVGVISTAIRKPDQYVEPWMFGHSVCKKTGLWLKNLPKLQPTNIVEKEEYVVFPSGKKMGKWYYETSCLPHKDRERVRSITFQGIADAMAEQWS